MSMFSALGVGSGIDLQALVDGLVAVEGSRKTALQTSVTKRNSLIANYQGLNSLFSNLRSAAEALTLPSNWKAKTASSSSTNVFAAATTSAVSGTFQFSVKQLATAQVMASLGSVSSTDAVIGTGSMLLGSGGALGIRSMSGDASLAVGSHTFTVTQASTGASISGGALADSVTIADGATLDVTIDGTARSIALTAGTYTRQGLADMIKSASGGDLAASVNANGSLKLATSHEGSSASLAIGSGTANGALGLTATGAVSGTDGVIEVDGIANTVSSIKPDGSNSVTLNASAGSVNVTFSGGLRVGEATMKNIDLGDGKLSTVADAINNANVGVSAAIVQVNTGEFRLQLQATKTGTEGAIAADFSKFSATLGELSTVSNAQNAVLQVGSGSGAYSISSSTNTLKDVLPGVTLTVKEANPSELVSVTVGGDTDAIVKRVASLVESVNAILGNIKSNSAYNPATKTGGVFMGNFAVQNLQRNLSSAMSQFFPSSSLNALAAVGIKSSSAGGFEFDQAKFKEAFAEKPQEVAALFLDGGTTGAVTGSKGLAEQLLDLSKRATDSVSGVLTTAIKGENTTIADLNKQIARWDDRLDAYRARLKRQFASVDTMISGFKSQQAWLSGQLATLPSSYR